MRWVSQSFLIFFSLVLGGCGGAAEDSSYSPVGISYTSPPYDSPDTSWFDPDLTFEDPGDRYENVGENPFTEATFDPFSTFAIDVDTASYDIFRRNMLGEYGLPDTDSVRVEEYINAFNYGYPVPDLEAEHPFSISADIVKNPIQRDTHVLRVGLQAAAPPKIKKPANLVFLIDKSGSMASSDKLPLVKTVLTETLKILDPEDTVAIVTYASGTEVRLEATPVSESNAIESVINGLGAGGSTAGAAGLSLAYEQAQSAFIEGGINHVILCSDGDFNVGPSTDTELVNMIEEQRESGITFTVLGFGEGNLNDAMMEKTSNAGNGIYGIISSQAHALDYVHDRMLSNLLYVAKDVKIQVEFNSSLVAYYRLMGYENRALEDEDFTDDTVDAGEIGAGHNVTALYEIVLADDVLPEIENAPSPLSGDAYSGEVNVASDEIVKVRVRYKKPDASTEDLAIQLDKSVVQISDEADVSTLWANAVATFSEILKGSLYTDKQALETIEEIIKAQQGVDRHRDEFINLYEAARPLIQLE